jgi:predicted PurR-regulated permease PerM
MHGDAGMNSPGTRPAAGRNWILTVAALMIIIYGLKTAQAIVVPILLALFVSMVGTPPLFWMRRKGVPNPLAVLAVVLGMLGILILIGSLVGTSIADFTSRVPYYQERLDEQLIDFLDRHDLDARIGSVRDLVRLIDPSGAMDLAARLLNGLGGVLNNALLIVFTVVFVLLEAWSFPRKLQAIAGSDDRSGTLRRFSESLNRYIGLKTAISLVTGVIVWVWVALMGLDFAMLWGLLAFMLNYVPNIGSIIAALPAVLLAVVQLGGGKAVLIAIGYMIINVLMGNLLEPRIMGRSMGLSTLVVFLSLIFWGWVLGPVGMLLSVPLTMTLVIALESSPATERFAVLLCEAPPVDSG